LYRNAALKSIRFDLFRSQDWGWVYAILSQVLPGVEQVVFDVQSLTEGSGLYPLQFALIDKLLQQRRLAQIQLIFTYLDDYRSSTQHVAWITGSSRNSRGVFLYPFLDIASYSNLMRIVKVVTRSCDRCIRGD